MPSCSNAVICVVNFITILIAVPLTCFGLWTKSHTHCQPSIPWVLIVTGVTMLVISLCGIFGSCCRLNFFLWIYLFLMFLLIVAASASMTFSFVVTSKSVGDAISEVKLGNSSSWIQKWATKDWYKTESCMKEEKLCSSKVMRTINNDDSTTGNMLKDTELYKMFSPLQLGCCRPPVECSFKYVNATFWQEPKEGNTTKEGDCKLWSNDDDIMCYGCETCKAGMVIAARKNLRWNAWGSMGVLIYLIIIYSIGCCAFRDNRADNYERYY